MRHKFGKIVVLALGGSIVYPGGDGLLSEGIDVKFLKNFRRFIKGLLRHGRKFIIVVGGGRLARIFQNSAHEVVAVTDEDKDWLGIHATRSNAHLLRTIFREVADPVVIDARHRIKKLRYPVTVASGWRPGWSTDYVAAVLANDFGVREFIVAGKPAAVYRADPRLRKNAKPINAISWSEYRKLIPAKWKPGLHAPVDPVAARFTEKERITAIIVNGKNLKNLRNLLRGENFRGTIVG